MLNNKKALLKYFKKTFIQNTSSLLNSKNMWRQRPRSGLNPGCLTFVSSQPVRYGLSS